jgi:hypothetical protein
MKTLKEVRLGLLAEATASKTDLQYIRAKTARNDHFATRIYIADRILGDKDLANAYKSLEYLHNKRYVGDDAVILKTKIRKIFTDNIKKQSFQLGRNME